MPRDEREKILNERSGPVGTDKMFSCPLVVRNGHGKLGASNHPAAGGSDKTLGRRGLECITITTKSIPMSFCPNGDG